MNQPEQLIEPSKASRTATEVINQAVRENRVSENLLYFIAIIVVLIGGFALTYGVLTRQNLAAVAGAVSSSLFVPAMVFAGRIRKENIALRLLEAPLSRADTAKEAAEALSEYFVRLNMTPNRRNIG
jgi:hypothetical protein